MSPESESRPASRSSPPRRVEPPGDGETTQRLARSSDHSDATVLSSKTPSFRGQQLSVQEIGGMLEGTALGVYQLEQFVGGGGMGAVFRARDTTLDRTVAVKVLFSQSAADEELLRRFRNEAQSAARLDHDNIGRVHAVGHEDGWHFIVLEFIEGRNLRDLVAESGPFTPARTVDVAVQVATALAHASEREVVHRDIKPSNIIITPDGRAKLVDMGLARLHHVTGANDLTVSGMTLGTFDYISPEQARDPRNADVRSDLYSLGCTLYFLLAGRPPFADGTMVQKLLQHQQDAAEPIEQIRPDVPRKLAAAVGKLMEKSPEDRYQHPADLVADLAVLAGEFGVVVGPVRPAPVSAPARRDGPSIRAVDHLPWLVPMLGLVAVVGVLFWNAAGDREPAAPIAPRDSRSEAPAPRVARPEAGRLAEAVAIAADGDVIELASSGVREESPFMVAGKRVVIRAAPGHSPVLRFDGFDGGDGGDGLVPTTSPGKVAIRGGSLAFHDVGIAWTPGVGDDRRRLFVLNDGGSLEFRGGSIETTRDGETRGVETSAVADGESAVLIELAADAPEQGEPPPRTVRLERATVSGDATVMRSVGGGRVDVTAIGCRIVTPRRFLLVEGGSVVGSSLRLSLEHSWFASGEGFACLIDSPARPSAPSLMATARESRFAVPDGAALLEQSGIGDPEQYRPAIEWIDVASRYEGSDVFRRVDGAAERVEMEFAASALPMDHSGFITEEFFATKPGIGPNDRPSPSVDSAGNPPPDAAPDGSDE